MLLREPKGRDLLSLEELTKTNNPLLASNAGSLACIASVLSVEPMTPDEVLDLPLKEYLEVVEQVKSFRLLDALNSPE